jgi:histidyl-tRNA synthetase
VGIAFSLPGKPGRGIPFVSLGSSALESQRSARRNAQPGRATLYPSQRSTRRNAFIQARKDSSVSKGSKRKNAGTSLQAPRGTRDFYPDEMRRRAWLFDVFRQTAMQFSFEEVDAPMVEHAELFIRKAGEEIVDQLYHFELHDRHLALRPEMTPSIARMIIARQGAMRFPIRWFTLTQNWRYERMTRGRRREHYQWNMDIWGEPDVEAEAELLSAMMTALDTLGLTRGKVHIRLNSRRLLEESLRDGVLADRPEAFEPLCVVIDKIDKIGAQAVTDLLCETKSEKGEAIGLSAGEAEKIGRAHV